MAYQKPSPKWDWRKFLTAEEASELAAAESAKRVWLRLNKGCAGIKNRALQRAKGAAGMRAEQLRAHQAVPREVPADG